ncbi:extracellular solute-binding protein [Paenibacillus sp. IB182496]|uniref:Extracellular solute-binding protein n=1 Tax=Paenibacillus sabuli TaxID=2772509 RepID=A0A927BY96_9BACL|nr:extracellular solute-binding protein [Paenibacillus sabuli]MBD2847523.1 extracellular solute-binding protein [Paenibacillus sabuli]
MSKHKKWTQTAMWSLAAVLLLSIVLAGCSGGSNNDTPPSENDQVGESTDNNASGEAGNNGAGDEPVALSWMVRGVVLEDSFGEQFVEENFGVDLDIISVPGADYVQRQQIMMTTGEVPDVMFILDPNEMKKYANQGLLAEVPMDLIEQYAPGIRAEIDEHAPQGWYYTEYNGANYGVPTLYPSGRFTTPVTWRTDLLRQAGIDEIPETIDEMTAAFEALKQIDVYGMSTNGNSYYQAFQKIFGAYGVMPMQWTVRDGEVVNGAVLPEAKEALAQLAEWYQNGYIDPEFVTGANMDTKYTDGVFAFSQNSSIYSTDESNPNSAISVLRAVNPDGEIAFGPLPKGPRGESGGWAWGGAGNIFAFGKQLEDHPEKMQKALEIMNEAVTDQEMFFTLAFGEEGTHWEYVNGTDFKEGITAIPPYDDPSVLQEEGIGMSRGASFFGHSGIYDFYEMYTGASIMELNNMYLDGSMYDIFGKPDILPSAGQYWGDLQKLKTETYAKIIRGDQPVDYFDSFVQQWNEMGGEQLREEGQALYDSLQ